MRTPGWIADAGVYSGSNLSTYYVTGYSLVFRQILYLERPP